MANDTRDPNASYPYRNRVTGLVETLPLRVGDTFDHLEQVSEDTKPLAYTPIPKDAADEARAQSKSKSAGDAPRDENEGVK